MKNFIVLIVMLFSFQAQSMVTFDHWTVTAEADLMMNSGVVEGKSVGVGIFKTGTLFIYINHKPGSSLGELVLEDNITVTINNQLVKMTRKIYSNGTAHYFPLTDEGAKFMGNQLWDKVKVYFKVDGFVFWISAKGVQKAWSYMNKVRAI